jgi:hypothetical protein
VARAREEATARGLDAGFEVADALDLGGLGRVFETVLDCGLFHTFDGDERRDYVASLAGVTRPGGRLHLLCFSDVGTGLGPHPVSEQELRAPFSASAGWRVEALGPERCLTRFHGEDGAPAWLATLHRLETDGAGP